MGPWYGAWRRKNQEVHLHLLVISTCLKVSSKEKNKIIPIKKQPGLIEEEVGVPSPVMQPNLI